jgi:hypothetical protein
MKEITKTKVFIPLTLTIVMSLKDPNDDYDEILPSGNNFVGKMAGKAKGKAIILIIGIIIGLIIHYYLINPFIIADSQQISKDCLNSKLLLNKENECLYTLVSEPKLAGEKCGVNNLLVTTSNQETPPTQNPQEKPLDQNLLTQEEKTNYSSFHLYYYTTAEVAYEKIQIDGNKLKHEYLDTNKVASKCVNWIQQSPCWTQEDILKKSKTLTQTEMDTLNELINQYKYFDLNNYYGPMNEDGTNAEVRCYSYELSIEFKTNDKKVIFCDRPVPPESGPMPTAFRKIMEKIQTLSK